MPDEKLHEWIEWRLNSEPRPTGSAIQRRLGAAEVLFDMLLKVTPPEKSDSIATLVEQSAAQGKAFAVANLWLMNAWAIDMQRQANGQPRRLECASIDDSEATHLTEHAVVLLCMYAAYANPGAVDEISSAVSHQILLQPRLQGLSNDEINNKLAIRDAFLMEGIEAHALSLDLLSLLVDVTARTEAAKRDASPVSAPAPSPTTQSGTTPSPKSMPAVSPSPPTTDSGPRCLSGHPMEPKDSKCPVCGKRIYLQFLDS